MPTSTRQSPKPAPAPKPQAPWRRRALTNQGGAVVVTGQVDAARQLATALEAATEDANRFTHGFHVYPARMHPSIARMVTERFSQPGDFVLDPFCGSGTVLIEAMLTARSAVGVDLSPLALRIAEVQCALRGEAERKRFVHALEQVTSASLERVRSRTRARARLSVRERALYEPHVLIELAGLLDEIRKQPLEADRRALELVFSTLLIKFSRKRADTSDELAVKRIRKGLTSEFFLKKGRELAQRWEELANAAPQNAPTPLLLAGDARELPRLVGKRRFALVLSSPPYGGTYDYHAQHALRCTWLGLDARELERAELGARRRLSQGRDATVRWERELSSCLRSIAAVCKPHASVVLLIGDAEVGGVRIDAGAQLARLANGAGLTWVAAAAQARADYQTGHARKEHLVLLRAQA